MNSALLLSLALCAIPPGEIKTIIAVEADVVFRESLPSLPDDFGDKKPKGAAFNDEPKSVPELWAYSMAGCAPCQTAKAEISVAKDLPFRVVWKDGDPPAHLGLGSRPAFWWSTDTDRPEGSRNGRTLQGWHGTKHLQEQWKKTRVDPKRFERSPSPKQSQASVIYHSGHDCPKCGREQYTIKSQSGPSANTHTHQCGSCGTAWYHMDQSPSSGSKRSKSFLGITWQ